jgi:hypothetical protein
MAAFRIVAANDSGKDQKEARALEPDYSAEPEDDSSLVVLGYPDAGPNRQRQQNENHDRDG